MKAIKSAMRDELKHIRRRILHCTECGAEFSGHRGNYWNRPEDHVFTCRECGGEMELVFKNVHVTYTDA